MWTEGDVGVNANYLSHAFNSVISSGLAIRLTDDVVMIEIAPPTSPCFLVSAPPPEKYFPPPLFPAEWSMILSPD